MPFICERCGYTTHNKAHFKSHCYRKIVCKEKLSNASIESIIEQYWPADKQPVQCPTCEKKFSSKKSLYDHTHKRRCKHTIIPFEAKPKSDEDVKATIGNNSVGVAGNHNNVSVANSNNSTTNIQVLAFGKSDLDYIMNNHAFMMKCIKNRTVGMCDLLERMHFDPEHPENHNVRKNTKKDAYIDLHDGERWTTGLPRKVLASVMLQMERMVMGFYDQCFKEKKKVNMNATRRFMEEVGVPLRWDIDESTDYECGEEYGEHQTESMIAETNAELLGLFKKCLYDYTAKLAALEKEKARVESTAVELETISVEPESEIAAAEPESIPVKDIAEAKLSSDVLDEEAL